MGLGCGVVARCTCHMPAAPLRVPSRINSHIFSTIMCVAVNMAVQPSSHSCSMYISALDWMWGKMCSVLSPVDNKKLILVRPYGLHA